MYDSKKRIGDARTNTSELQNAVRRRLTKGYTPLLKTKYAPSKRFTAPDKEKG